ncbi:MAG: stage III sporulation protein AB [Roseburia sp.]|nr:stage III sporulation protein AB [Roseburia sp.]
MLGASGFGWSLCQEMKRMLFHLEEQKRMLLYIEREISFMHRPMQENLVSVSGRLREPYHSFVLEVAARMEERDGKSLRDIWHDRAEQGRRRGEYPAEAVRMLHRMEEVLGCEEDKMQIEALRLLETELAELAALRAKEKEEKSRLIQTLSVLAGIFCIVLFI